MNDRELLELAAKAAGIEDGADRIDSGLSLTEKDGRHRYLPRWNPREDDGDALRLAVKRGINLSFSMPDRVCTWCDAIGDWIVEMYAEHATREDATRRAIVRAAAEIGRGMK